MTFPLLASAAFAAPALFPDLSPVAVWVWWKADDFGSNETTLRAIEARDWLDQMQPVRVG